MSSTTHRRFTGILIVCVALLLAGCGAVQTTTTQPSTAASTSTAAASTSTIPSASTTPGASAAASPGTPSSAATAETTSTATGAAATPAIVAAANAFLATLSDSEKTSVQFDWTDTDQKQRWSNLPEGLFDRAGLKWGDLSEPQQTAWLAVMQATLSTEGYSRVIAEWNADDVLAAEGGGGGLHGRQM